MCETTLTDNVARVCQTGHIDFSEYLSSAYEVLRKIFSYLPIEDLENVGLAYGRWKDIIETTKRERTNVESFVITSLDEKLEIWGEASFCFTVCVEENDEVIKKLKKHLKKDAGFIVLESRSGIIGTYNNLLSIVQLKTPFDVPMEATHLRIPAIPNVGIKTFVWKRNMKFTDVTESFSLPDNQIIKCLLIFIAIQDNNRKPCRQKDDFVLYLQSTQKEGFAVGGCLMDSFLDDDEDTITKYIVFYGDKVEAASTALRQYVKSRESIEAKIEEFKMACPVADQAILFVFRCCSRDKLFTYNKLRKGSITTWEGQSLTKHFPHIPMIGCLGYGEFGRKFPDKKSRVSNAKRARQCDIWEYSFSTTIVYIGFKK